MVILLFNMFNHPGQSKQETSYSEFITAVSDGEVNQVTIQGNEIYGKYKDGTSFRTFVPNDPNLIRELRDKGVQISAKDFRQSGGRVSLVHDYPHQLVPHAPSHCRMDLLHAPNAGRWRQSYVLRQKQS